MVGSATLAEESSTTEAALVTVTTVFDPATQYLGPCAVVSPPTADPCQAAQGMLSHSFWGNMVNAKPFKNWRRDSPGDYQRLLGWLAAPRCSNAPTGLAMNMVTFYGAALVNTVWAYACALGTEPIALPAPNPAPAPGATDKTPPSAPGPITVVPGG